MKAFDLTDICIGLLPVCLRRPVVCAVLRCAVSALQQQHDTIHTTHCGTPRGTYYRLAHTGQVCSLESLLNDRFDPERRRIVIGTGEGNSRWYIYREDDISETGGTLYLRTTLWADADADTDPERRPTPLYFDEDYVDATSADTDFIVSAPDDIRTLEAAIRASIDDMRIAGTVYILRFGTV